jgi:serine protease inhibitor
MPDAPKSKAPRRFRRLFLFGLLFEVFVLTLCALLPGGSWLSSEICNDVFVIHSPLLWLLNVGAAFDNPLAAIFCLLLFLFLMAAFWAFLFYWVLRLGSWLLARIFVSQRQKLVVRCGLGFVCLLVLALAAVSAMPQTSTPFTASPEIKSIVENNNAFALDLYQKLKEQPGNLFFSPYSISTSLAMTYAGARGQTKSEMAKVLHFNPGQTNIHATFGSLTERLNKVQRWNRITFITANSLWCEKDYPFMDTFLDIARMNYDADMRFLDFKTDAETARGKINSWVEKKTKGKIQNLVEPGQFTPLTRLVLCNAIYFKGKWQFQFKPSDTKPAPFYITTNQTVTVPMMWQHSDFKMTYNDDESIELLEMPYIGNDLSMIILLPTATPELSDAGQNTLSDLEQNLTAENLHAWLVKLDEAGSHKASVWIPRFTTTQSFDLSKELKSLGMTSAFDDTANFSGMDGTTNLFISGVIHKAFVEVNEEGTEAAAATWVHVMTKSMAEHFVANHPFIFLIRDNGSGTILFLGRIVDPTK